MLRLALPAAGLAALLAAGAGWAQQPYPSKPIRVIVAFAPGGIADFAARSVSQKLSESLGVPVVVENRAGAGGITGAEVVAKSAPDGYTLLVTSISHTINPSLRKNLPFDAVRDFTPVTLITDAPNFLVVHPSLPVHSVKALVALARARPGQITYASSGTGTSTHLSGELFKSLARIDIVHVPYKGGGPAVIDLVGGHVQMMFSTLPSVLHQVRAGKLRGLAVTGARRFPAAQEFPTMIEAGVAGFEVSGWSGLFAPAGTPREAVSRLAAEIRMILQAPELKERFFVQGAEPVGNTPEEFAAFVGAEIAKWTKVVEASGMRAD
ncbi:MAG TPA: tripartite tricarboxylate transporter substrate binding protein [Burkholderiales bacterium]|nr:tripartite tricarboxylate transporter substrate binding protein [Burkholderiales bacterium]